MKNFLFLIALLCSVSVFSQEGRISPTQLQKLDGRWMTNDITADHILFAKSTNDPKWVKLDSLITAKNLVTTSTNMVGDVTGTFLANTVTKIRGTNVVATAPTSGQFLKFDGTNWTPSADNNNTYTAGTGISVSSFVITNTGDTNASDDITTASTAAGDVTGTFPTLSVVKLRGVNISSTAPTTNQYLRFDGTNWVPTTLAAAESLTYIGTVDITTGASTATMAGITAVDTKIVVLRNGQWTKGGAGRSWTKSGNVFTFTTALVPGDVLDFYAIQ
jgi:hypothetical protein